MADWQRLGLEVPQEVVDAVNTAQGIVNQLQSIVETIKDFVDEAAILLAAIIDPIQALLAAVIQIIEDAIQDFLNTGIFVIGLGFEISTLNNFKDVNERGPISELKTKHRENPGPFIETISPAPSLNQLLEVLNRSFFDEFDPDRPAFSPTAQMGGIVAVLGIPVNLQLFFDGDIPTIVRRPEILADLNRWKLIADFFKLGKEFKIALERFEQLSTNPIVELDENDLPSPYPFTVLSEDAPQGATTLELGQTVGGEELFIDVIPSIGALLINGKERVTYTVDTLGNITLDRPTLFTHGAGERVELRTVAGKGERPNWFGLTLAELVPAVTEIVEGARKLSIALSVGLSLVNFIEDFANFILDQVTLLLNRIDAILDKVAAILALVAALEDFAYMLFVETNQGPRGFMSEVFSANNPPDFGTDATIIGLCAVTGTVGIQPMKDLFGIS